MDDPASPCRPPAASERRCDPEVALAEAVHRARNDLQAVASMLRLHADAAPEPAVRAALLGAAARVRALCRLNARLDAAAEEAGGAVDSADFFAGLARDLRAAGTGGRPVVALGVAAERHRLAAAVAKPLGLIANELVGNALKYAFPDGRPGSVCIDFRRLGGACVLTVSDDGVGAEPGARPRGTGAGLRVVRALAGQIGGTFEIGRGARGVGTECVVRFPAARAAPVR